MTQAILDLENELGYIFKNKNLLEKSLTLANGSHRASYERLEFLGDRVLGLVIAEMLYQHFPSEEEGDLAKRHTKLVRAETAILVAEKLKLHLYLNVSEAEQTNIEKNPSVYLCDVLEAIIGAIYLDSDLDSAKQFIITNFEALMLQEKTPPQDAKTRLQEWVQAKGLPLPLYETENITGPEHAPVFLMALKVHGYAPVMGEGESKKKAEQAAAESFLKLRNEI